MEQNPEPVDQSFGTEESERDDPGPACSDVALPLRPQVRAFARVTLAADSQHPTIATPCNGPRTAQREQWHLIEGPT